MIDFGTSSSMKGPRLVARFVIASKSFARSLSFGPNPEKQCAQQYQGRSFAKSTDLNWYAKMGERDSQIEERGTTADDELSIERINIRQAPGAIGTKEELVTIDNESPGLGIVAGRCEDRVADREARLVYS